MKKITNCIILMLCIAAFGCATTPRDQVFQTSTIDALLAGVYDGHMTCGDLLKHGGFGIGTFDNLDGEMIVLDGEVYQIKADGRVYTPPLTIETPFATVTSFEAEKTARIMTGADCPITERTIDALAPNKNLFCAIRIDGTFRTMKTRSVPAQKKPYPPLVEVTKTQPVFDMTDVSGTIVGFRCPAYVKGINVPGYHLHFLSDDRTKGGHILDFTIDHATASIDMSNRYVLVLPTEGDSFANTDLSTDRSQELKSVEK